MRLCHYLTENGLLRRRSQRFLAGLRLPLDSVPSKTGRKDQIERLLQTFLLVPFSLYFPELFNVRDTFTLEIGAFAMLVAISSTPAFLTRTTISIFIVKKANAGCH